METIHYQMFPDLNKLKVSLVHEETSEIGKRIGVEILTHIQIFILVKAAFLLEGNPQFGLIVSQNKQTKYGFVEQLF